MIQLLIRCLLVPVHNIQSEVLEPKMTKIRNKWGYEFKTLPQKKIRIIPSTGSAAISLISNHPPGTSSGFCKAYLTLRWAFDLSFARGWGFCKMYWVFLILPWVCKSVSKFLKFNRPRLAIVSWLSSTEGDRGCPPQKLFPPRNLVQEQ